LERLESALADRYAAEAEIGRGGMAAVFLAEDLKHHRKVAIKVLHPELAATVGSERFLREIEIAANLDHPHILTLLDSGEADGLLFYVMPYVDGESLRDRLEREGQLPIDEAVQIAREIADGLGHAHRHGVIHRDIKPANIMLSDGHAAIADFGIARAVGGDGQALTSTGLAVGTPAYMSPEQASGGEVGERGDLYALGCVLYEMLAGEPPLTGATPQATAAMRLTETATPLPVVRDTVPGGLERVVSQLLAKTPADRYETSEKLIKALDRPDLWADTKPGRRLWRQLGSVAVVLVLLAAGVFATQWFASSGGDLEVVAQRVGVLPFENRTGDRSLDDLGELAAERITTRLQREEVGEVVPASAVAAAASVAGGDPVRAVAAATGTALVITGSFSESGDSLVVAIQMIDGTTGVQVGSLEISVLRPELPGGGLEEISSRVAGGLLLAFHPDSHPAWVLSVFPTVEAARLHREGSVLNRDGRYQESITRYNAAWEQDTTFWLPLYWAVGAYHNTGETATADSLNRVIGDRYRPQMSEVQRHFYDGTRAWFERDLETAIAMQRRVAATLPDSWTVRQLLSYYCFAANRPREALETMRAVEVEIADDPAVMGWHLNHVITAYHMLGEYEAELEASRRSGTLGVATPMGLAYETGRAFAALGHADEVRKTQARIESLADSTAQAGLNMLAVGLELVYHGSSDEADAAIRRAVQWFEERPERVEADPVHRKVFGAALYHAGRWEDAGRVLAPLHEAMPMNVDVLGYLGLVAARRSDPESAAEFSGNLAEIGSTSYKLRASTWAYRARIAAVLDERVQAVAHLKRAFDEALFYWPRADLRYQYRFDFQAHADYAPYQELLRPKG
jgi:tRNA A-37 threonylcarbamoyl transferase component Bud32/TolB-like protein/tetratricopeptide (TPR) repeat protein